MSDDEEDEQRAPVATKQPADPFSDPRLRPLHLLDPSGDAASIERYLHKLEKDPHVDSRLLQEGLQASKRLSNDYTKGQQAITRSRGYSSVGEAQADSQGICQDVRNQQMERNNMGETSAEQGSQGRQRIVRVEPSITASLPSSAQLLKDKSSAAGHSMEHAFEDAKVKIHGDVSTSSQKAEALLHTHGGHGMGEGLATRAHRAEGAVESIESELHGLDIRHEIQKSEHGPKDRVHKLEGVDLTRDVKEGVHELKNEMHIFEGSDLIRDIRTGEHDLDVGIRHAEKAVESALPGGHILQAVQKGEQDLRVGVRVAEGAIERGLKGLNLEQAFRTGKHDLGASVNNIAKPAENVLPDSERGIRESEQNLKNHLLRDASMVEKALPNLDLHKEASEVAADLAKDFRDTADAAEQEFRKVDGRGLVEGVEKDGRAVEINLERLGTSIFGHVSKDEHTLVKDTRAMGRFVEDAGENVRRSAGNGVRMGDTGVKHASKAEVDLRYLIKEGRQGRDRAPNSGPSSSPKVLPHGTRLGKPATSSRPTDMGEPSRPHPHGSSDEPRQLEQRRGDLLNDKGFPYQGATRQTPPHAPSPPMAPHGPVRPITNPAPAGSHAPYPSKNEPTRATMPTMPSESNHLGPTGQGPTQRRPGEVFNPQGSNKIAFDSGQAAGPNPNQTGQKSVQSRLARSDQAPRSNMTNPHLSQSAAPPTGPSSLRPDQQRHVENQSRNHGFEPSLARHQGHQYQALSINQLAQPGQSGANQPAMSNVKVPTRVPPPRVEPANLAPQHRQEPRSQGTPNNQLGKGTPPQQAPKPAQDPQVLIQNDRVPSGRHSKQQEPGPTAQSSIEDQRKAQIQGNGKVAAKPIQGSLSKTKPLQQKATDTTLRSRGQKTEDGPESQHKGHRANDRTQQSETQSAAKRLSQTSTVLPSPVSGPQQMLNMFKARSEASIDAAGGCPGFVDRKSPHLSIRYLRARSSKLTCSCLYRDDPVALQDGTGRHARGRAKVGYKPNSIAPLGGHDW